MDQPIVLTVCVFVRDLKGLMEKSIAEIVILKK